MDIAALRQLGKIAGWISSALLFISLLCLADALREGFMDGKREYQAVPGEVIEISCPMPPGATGTDTISLSGGDDFVSIKPEQVYSGFWLGATMWKGVIAVREGALPGDRIFQVRGTTADAAPDAPVIAIKVTVHGDPVSRQASSPSYIMRHWGLKPSLAALGAFLAATATGFAGFLAVRRIESMLTLEGKGVVYMMKQTGEGSLIGFSLGLEQGLSPGMSVRLFDRTGRGVGVARVTAALADDSTALVVSGTCELGDMVERVSEEPGPRIPAPPLLSGETPRRRD